MDGQRPSRSGGIIAIGPVPPPVHGAARVTESVVAQLAASGVTPTVVNTAVPLARGPRYHAIRAWRHLSAVARLVGLRHSNNLVYIGGAGGKGLWYQALVVATARMLRTTIYFHHHSFAYLNNHSLAMRAIVAAGGRDCTHIALCNRMASELARCYPRATRIIVCSNAGLLPPPPASLATGSRERRFSGVTLCHLSNLSLEKGLAVVLQTFSRLYRRGLDVRLLIAGPALGAVEEAMLVEAAADFGDAFEWRGLIPPAEVPDFFAEADLFLFASAYLHEAEPLVVLEAARVGTPAVIIDVGCLSSLVVDESFAVADVATFHEKVESTVIALLSGTPEAKALRTRAGRHFESMWGGSRIAHDDLTERLIAEGSTP